MTLTAPPAAPLPDDDVVMLIADPRLDALRGQTLVVGECIVAIPVDPGPIPVPAEAARVLLKQAGWRLAPGGVAPRVDGPPPPAKVIPNPQRTRDDLGRLQTARVASPSAAEMAAREQRTASTSGTDTVDTTLLLETLAHHLARTPEAGPVGPTGIEPEEAASPASFVEFAPTVEPSPVVDSAPTVDPAPTSSSALDADTRYVSEPSHSDGFSSSSSDLGGGSYDSSSGSSDSND